MLVLTFIARDKITGNEEICLYRSQGGTTMAGQLRLTVVTILISFEYAKGGKLWCYDCNTDLRGGHTTECNDPYIPAPYFYLVLCPQNESHHCLKSVITYRDISVTVRGCVPSHEIDGYCQQEKYFPESSSMCSFCDTYACNGQGSVHLFMDIHFIYFVLLPLFICMLIYYK
ncbi:uncharacterized protein LOC143378527 [Andrena cerasifolii]|uniref:uncharacterized protein LOC143378527 n=1 Tax=Andrena cerasifolii TaxID=2819439 RepID=UPI004037E574